MSVVLPVDDEPALGSLVDHWLAELGARVVQVGTLDQAIATPREHHVNAVLLDISLDGADGLDLLPLLKEERSLTDTPVDRLQHPRQPARGGDEEGLGRIRR